VKVFIAIDPDVCIGVGKCEELEPYAVELGEDGISRPLPGIALPRERAGGFARRVEQRAHDRRAGARRLSRGRPGLRERSRCSTSRSRSPTRNARAVSETYFGFGAAPSDATPTVR
jgi:ferredoxin